MKIPTHCPFCSKKLISEYKNESIMRYICKSCYWKDGYWLRYSLHFKGKKLHYVWIIPDDIYLQIRFNSKETIIGDAHLSENNVISKIDDVIDIDFNSAKEIRKAIKTIAAFG